MTVGDRNELRGGYGKDWEKYLLKVVIKGVVNPSDLTVLFRPLDPATEERLPGVASARPHVREETEDGYVLGQYIYPNRSGYKEGTAAEVYVRDQAAGEAVRGALSTTLALDTPCSAPGMIVVGGGEQWSMQTDTTK